MAGREKAEVVVGVTATPWAGSSPTYYKLQPTINNFLFWYGQGKEIGVIIGSTYHSIMNQLLGTEVQLSSAKHNASFEAVGRIQLGKYGETY